MLAFIFHGKHVAEEKINYLASIRRNGTHFCSGSLIHDDFILTTAHCTVQIYRWNKSNYKEFTVLISKTLYEVLNAVSYKEYEPRRASHHIFNDYGLVNVSELIFFQ